MINIEGRISRVVTMLLAYVLAAEHGVYDNIFSKGMYTT